MRGWLEAWGEKAEGPGGHGAGMDMSNGLMSDQEMGELEKAYGSPFDRLFLTMMVRHHKGALETAKTDLDEGKYPLAKTRASRITTSQASEIDQMEGLLSAVPQLHAARRKEQASGYHGHQGDHHQHECPPAVSVVVIAALDRCHRGLRFLRLNGRVACGGRTIFMQHGFHSDHHFLQHRQ